MVVIAAARILGFVLNDSPVSKYFESYIMPKLFKSFLSQRSFEIREKKSGNLDSVEMNYGFCVGERKRCCVKNSEASGCGLFFVSPHPHPLAQGTYS